MSTADEHCATCGAVLSPDERVYYGHSCDACEDAKMNAGGHDPSALMANGIGTWAQSEHEAEEWMAMNVSEDILAAMEANNVSMERIGRVIGSMAYTKDVLASGDLTLRDVGAICYEIGIHPAEMLKSLRGDQCCDDD